MKVNTQVEIERRSETEVLPEAFVPDTLLPEQYFDRLTARASDAPEKRLMFAVLLDAVIQLQRRHTRGAAEAEEWIRADEDSDSPFAFANICVALGIDPLYLSRGLLAWCENPAPVPLGVPVRQLRTSRRRITPLRRRRRRATRGGQRQKERFAISA
jgi:hypothetical protein